MIELSLDTFTSFRQEIAGGIKMRKWFIPASLLIVIGLRPSCLLAAVIRVPEDYPSIREAIDVAQEGDTVRISDGIFSGENNKNLGWDASTRHLTIESENGPDNCIIDCESSGCGFFFFNQGHTHADTVSGLTIRNGSAQMGGAVYCSRSAPYFQNCTFSNNTATDSAVGFGGAVYAIESGMKLENCRFIDNYAFRNGGGVYSASSTLEITGCMFTGNACYRDGGGLSCYYSDLSISGCTFSGNTAQEKGGALLCLDANPVIRGNIFSGNRAMFGGAIACSGTSTPVIGDGAGWGNTFQDNTAGAGADLFSPMRSGALITGIYNTFSGIDTSDYYVSPQSRFSLENSTCGLTPITQNVYVAADGDDSNDGLTPATAFQTVQHACRRIVGSTSDPVTINIGAGTFSPSETGEQFPLPLLDFVRITGAGRDATILDAEATAMGIIGYHEDGAGLSNLTVRGGAAYGGGGLYLNRTSPIVTNCRFSENSGLAELSFSGSGVVCRASASVFENCEIINNYSEILSGFNSFESGHVTLMDCLISGNVTGSFGGGINGVNGSIEIDHSVISGNQAYRHGGAYFQTMEVMMDCCLVDGNQAESGGGIAYIMTHGHISNSVYSGNTSTDEGGAIYLEEAIQEFINCTISGNSAVHGGAVSSWSSEPMFLNCILWGNAPDEIHDVGSIISITYSDIAGGYTGTGNIDENPLFTSSADFHLQVGSPCIDAGTDIGAPSHDFDGNARPVCGVSDIGAFEYPGGPAESRVYIRMPAHLFLEGDECWCKVILWNADGHAYSGYPVFVLFQLFDYFYFAPSFSSFDHYDIRIETGETYLDVLPPFYLPAGAGQISGACFYAAVTDPEISELLWNLAIWEFGWDL